MNRKYPPSRPFFTIRGFIWIGMAIGFALVVGFLAATYLIGRPA